MVLHLHIKVISQAPKSKTLWVYKPISYRNNPETTIM